MGPVGGNPGPIQPIGGAAFTVTANTQPFNQALQQAQQQAQQFHTTVTASMTGVTQSVGANTGRSSYGLLMLGQTMDDLQYGFRAIVNNIPQLVTGLGGSAGLAGAAALAAVAVNQLAQKWDQLQDLFSNAKGIDAAKTSMEGFVEWINANPMILGPTGQLIKMIHEGAAGQTVKDQALEAEAKRAAKGRAAIEGAQSKDQAKQGKLFKEALDEYGGDRLMNEMLAKRIDGRNLTQGQIDYLKKQIEADVGQALTGRMAPANYEGHFGGAFAEQYGKTLHDSQAAKRKENLAKQEAETEKAIREEEAEQKHIDDLNRQGQQIEAQTRQEQVEDQAADLRKRARFLQDRAGDMGRSQVFQGTRAFATGIMTDALNRIPQAQLDEAKRLNGLAEKMLEELRKERRFAVFK